MPSQRHSADSGISSDPVLVAARACILAVGLRRTTIADIARRAGLSRMTVYRQYGDLSAIVGALLTTELVALIDVAGAEVSRLTTGRDRLVAAAGLVVERLAVHPLWCRVLDLDPELLLPLVVDRFGGTQKAAIEVVAEQVRQGQADGSVRDGDPGLLATCLLLTAQSFVFSARIIAADHKQEHTSRELQRLLDGYLREVPA